MRVARTLFVHTKCGSRPQSRAAAAVALQWLDCRPPMVTTLSCPCASASAISNSSFLTLLPPSSLPERSSRLIHHSTPMSCSAGQFHGMSGVGRCPSRIRSSGGGFKCPAHVGARNGTRCKSRAAIQDLWTSLGRAFRQHGTVVNK